jgi:starch synthase
MHTQEGGASALLFEIQVAGETYRSLVGGLRSLHASSVPLRSSKRSVKAVVEVDPLSRTFSINTLGGHRLPRPLRIREGSTTYQNVAHLISHALTAEERELLQQTLRDIILLTSTPPLKHLRIHRNDFEMMEADGPLTSLRGERRENKRFLCANILLEFDDSPTLVVPDREERDIAETVERLRASLRVVSPPRARAVENFVEVTTTLSLSPSSTSEIEIWIHWGSYEDLAPSWQDEQLTSVTGSQETIEVPLYFRAHIPIHGWYGATFFAQVRGSSERVWIGGLGDHDARFHITSDNSSLMETQEARFVDSYYTARQLVSVALENSSLSSETLEELESIAPHASLASLIEAHFSSHTDENAATSTLRATGATSGWTKLNEILTSSYGIGEVVFATPEGPHAAAGGLAQVISGLPPELARAGVPVSIIAPLYRYANGNKHPSAEETLQRGVTLHGRQVKPHYIGSVTVDLGPTASVGTNYIRRTPSSLPIKIYLAQSGRLRLFLLANNSAFDRLYQPVYADEQLRRAIILSRAVLETISTGHLGIRPSVIISNDWLTACVPSFFALDSRYKSVPWLAKCKTVHMIHNGGADYHGRLPCHLNNEDLWPLLNLSPEHYFGFRDPHREDLINLTLAATQHATGGVLTVSQPYAHELLSSFGGDGLERVLQRRSTQVYGVSNGIDRKQLTSYLSATTGLEHERMSHIDSLLQAKHDAKGRIQSRYGLTIDANATIVSFVGRLAEQKGLHLLSGIAVPAWHSTLEEFLLRHESTQLIVAGPPTAGDHASDSLRTTLHHLQRRYPGRVAVSLEYVPHSVALEIMLASSLFLMPSRFEPGGITQLEALAMGTLVVGRNVGGISATIQNYCANSQTGNGFLCDEYSPTAFSNTVDWALTTIKSEDAYRGLVSRAISAKHAWSDRTPLFLAVLQDIILGRNRSETLAITQKNREILRSATIC